MKSKLIFIFVVIIFILGKNTNAQNFGVLSGTVLDSTNHQPIEFASISVIKISDSSAVTGTMTDNKGRFEIPDIPVGNYFLRISSVGYITRNTSRFSITSKNNEINAGSILLTGTEVNLDEISVTSNKIMLNNSIDRKVYNVQMDIMSKTGTAAELLQNIPSVQVDIDGNVSLRGSTNVLILINGKTSPLMGKTRADVLQQMPANSIEKIEVITNPSAKYKPDGTSGIINIVMKKEMGSGLNGNITASIGNQERYNGNTTLNYKPGKVNYFGSLSLRQDDRNSISSDIRTQYGSGSNISGFYDNNSKSYSRPLSRGGMLGFDYNIDKSNSIGITGNYFYRGFTRNDISTYILRDQNQTVTTDYDRSRVDPEYEKEGDVNAYFQHNFSGDDHKIRFEINDSFSPEVEDNHYTNTYRVPSIYNEYDNTLIKQDDNKIQLLAEYSNPISESATFEAGYNGELNKRDMDFYGEAFDPIKQKFVTDIVKTNHFIYNEDIHAVYTTYSNSFGPFGILGGLRAEQSFIKANLVSMNNIITNNYFNIYPTLHLSYKLNELMQLQLNYSKRANRPEGEDLNPFPEYQDPRNIRAGNPNLKPEFIHSIEFGFQWQTDFLTIVPSLFYRNRYNGITTVTKAINDTTLLTTRENLSSDQSAGLEIVFSGGFGNFITANLSGNAFYEKIDASNLGFSKDKSTITYSGNMSCNANLSSTTMLQINSNYRSSRLTPQGEFKPSFVFNLGIRQDLFDDKLSVVFTISDIFKTLNREMNFDTSWMKQNTINSRDSRIMYLGITYHLGKPSKKAKEKTIQYDNGN
ncbi:MAG: TonB-dependent receptor [Ignavibacteriales bacterium]|nr:MAG: TonB-dependent receptor [Ignavibacteriales bacterium]